MRTFSPSVPVPPPLSSHAENQLRRVECGPVPTQEMNPGVVRRLMLTGIVEIVDMPSPYRSHKPGTCVPHLRMCAPPPEAHTDD